MAEDAATSGEAGDAWAAEDQADLQRELANCSEPEEGVSENSRILGESNGGVHQPDAADRALAPAGEDKAMADPEEVAAAGAVGAGRAEGAPAASFWRTAPNASLGLAPWPPEFLAQQGAAPVVPLGLHAAGRPRLSTQAALSELVGAVQLQAAAAWGVSPTEFRLALRGAPLDPGVPLVHYINGGAVLEAVAPGPR